MEELLLKILLDVTEGAYSREELLDYDYEDKQVLDSLQVIKLVVKLETIFEIEIYDEDLSVKKVKSFETIMSLIGRLRKRRDNVNFCDN